MTLLLIGLVLFFAAHSVSVFNEGWRNRLVGKIGLIPWKISYSLVSIAGLALIVNGYGDTRLDPVIFYTPPSWTRHLAFLHLLPVFPLLLAASFPGRIQSMAKHPLLVATKLWASAHLLVNGSLADVVLFGSFLVWAVMDRISVARRTPRPTPGAPPSRANDFIVVLGGLALYAAFVLWLHAWLIGVPVIAI